MLWKLRHTNVVALNGIFVAGGQGVMLMELCEVGSLDRLLEADRVEGTRRAFSWYKR